MNISLNVDVKDLDIVGSRVVCSHDSDVFWGEKCQRVAYEVHWDCVKYNGVELEDYDHAEVEKYLIEESC